MYQSFCATLFSAKAATRTASGICAAVRGNLHRAMAEGAPVKGNFVWSAFDNLEWTGGYGARFGLVHVDFKTQKRTPKLSAAWFREAARRDSVGDMGQVRVVER